jgi:hypothetical protein
MSQSGREDGSLGSGIRSWRIVFVRVIEGSLGLLEEKRAEGRGCAEYCAIERHADELATGFAFAAVTIVKRRRRTRVLRYSCCEMVRLPYSGSPSCFAASRPDSPI